MENNQERQDQLELRYVEAKHRADVWRIDAEMDAEARGEKKCPETNEYTDKESCESSSTGIKHIPGHKTGCKYKNLCKVYNEFVEVKNGNG
jgi:hypothetical protein